MSINLKHFFPSGIGKVKESKAFTWLGVKTILNQYLTTTHEEKTRPQKKTESSKQTHFNRIKN